MQTVEALFADYASYHQTRGNKIFHRLGIPMIMFSLIGMLTYVPLFDIGTIRIDAAMVLIGLSSAYYFIIEWRLGIAMIAVSIVFYFLSAAIPLAINAILFVLGRILQFIVTMVLQRHGYRLEAASDGLEAVLKLGVSDYDVIVLDLMMPNLDGFTFLETIAHDQPERLRKVIVTSAASPSVIRERMADGPFRLLPKPFDIHELVHAVQSCIAAQA